MRAYDGIILGAGHNSLILQAYLGRSGLKVATIERRGVAGGGLSTMEDPRRPGFLHNTHSFYHRGIDRMPWYRDLELQRRGAVYVEPELNVAAIAADGRVLEWWTDADKTAESVAQFSRRDAEALRRWRSDFLPIVEGILVPEAQSKPLATSERHALLSGTAEGRLLLSTSALSPLEFVTREFEDPFVQAGLLFFNGLREVDPRVRGYGHHIPALLASRGKAQMCLGGSAALAQALERAVVDSGGEILLRTTPQRIIVEGGRAVGVETQDGEVIMARSFIASGLNPHQTFIELIDAGVLPASWVDRASAFRYNVVAPLFGLNLDLEEAPRYSAADQHPEIGQALMVLLGLEGIDQYPELVRAHEAGERPPMIMWGSTPTVFDPSQAPSGKHTAFMWEKVPYRLEGAADNWDRAKDAHGRAMLDRWSAFAPNIPDAIIDSFVRSPLDTERTFPNMRYGDLLVGAFTHGQTGIDRPFTGAGGYRTVLDGLYLCGSSSHPGGNITGLPGYNAAQVILADLGISADWMPRPLTERLARSV